MSTALSEQDLILLNAYLDDELSTGEKAAFQQRLIQEPALQAELESLRVTVAMLQMAERMPVPRNFTLDPAQYGTPRKVGLLARLGLGSMPRLVTAGASLLVVLLCVGVIIFNGGIGLKSATPSVAEEPMFALEAADAPAEEEAAEIEIAPAVAPDDEQRAAGEQPGEPDPEALAPQAAEGAVAEDSGAAVVEAEAVEEEMAEAAAAPAEEAAPVEEEPSEEEAMAEESVQMPSELPPGTGVGGGFGGASNGEGDQPAVLPTPTAPPFLEATPLPTSTMIAEVTAQPAVEGEDQENFVDEAGETAKAYDAQSDEQPGQPPAEQAATTAATTQEPSFPNWAIGLIVVIGLLVIVLAVLSIVILTRRRSL